MRTDEYSDRVFEVDRTELLEPLSLSLSLQKRLTLPRRFDSHDLAMPGSWNVPVSTGTARGI